MGCRACTGRGQPCRTVHDGVTNRTQYQSPDLIGAIAYGGTDPAADPLWHLSGAASRMEYRRWCRHCCGMACLQMVLEHRDGQANHIRYLRKGVSRSYHGRNSRRTDPFSESVWT
jgi:hypothetical protein